MTTVGYLGPGFRAAAVQQLLLGHNRLENAKGLQQFINLRKLSLAGNLMRDEDDFLPYLRNLRCLSHLSIRGNAVARLPDTRLKVVAALPYLQCIDGCDIKDSERHLASALWQRSTRLVNRVCAALYRADRLIAACGTIRAHAELRRRVDQDGARFCLPPGVGMPRPSPFRPNVGAIMEVLMNEPPTETFVNSARRRVRQAIAALFEKAAARNRRLLRKASSRKATGRAAAAGAPTQAHGTTGEIAEHRPNHRGLKTRPAVPTAAASESHSKQASIGDPQSGPAKGQGRRYKRANAASVTGPGPDLAVPSPYPTYASLAAGRERQRLQRVSPGSDSAPRGKAPPPKASASSRGALDADPLDGLPEISSSTVSPELAALHRAQARVLANALDAEAEALRACEREADRDFLMQKQVASRDPGGLRDAVIEQESRQRHRLRAIEMLDRRHAARQGRMSAASSGAGYTLHAPDGDVGKGIETAAGDHGTIASSSGTGAKAAKVHPAGSLAASSSERGVPSIQLARHRSPKSTATGGPRKRDGALQLKASKVSAAFLDGPIDPVEASRYRGQGRAGIYAATGRSYGRRPSSQRGSPARSPRPRSHSAAVYQQEVSSPPHPRPFPSTAAPMPLHRPNIRSHVVQAKQVASKGRLVHDSGTIRATGTLKPGMDFEARTWRTDDFGTPSTASTQGRRPSPEQDARATLRASGHLPWLDGELTQRLPTSLCAMQRQIVSMDHALYRERRRRHDRDTQHRIGQMQLLSRHGTSHGDSSPVVMQRESNRPPREDVIQSGLLPADRADASPTVPRGASDQEGRVKCAASSKSSGASTSDEGEAPLGESNTASALRAATNDQCASGSTGKPSGTLDRVDTVVPVGASNGPAGQDASSANADVDSVLTRRADSSSQDAAERGPSANVLAKPRPAADRSPETIDEQDSARTRQLHAEAAALSASRSGVHWSVQELRGAAYIPTRLSVHSSVPTTSADRVLIAARTTGLQPAFVAEYSRGADAGKTSGTSEQLQAADETLDDSTPEPRSIDRLAVAHAAAAFIVPARPRQRKLLPWSPTRSNASVAPRSVHAAEAPGVQDGTGVEASVAATGVQDGTGVEASVAATGVQDGTGVEASVAATGVQDGTGVEASVAATGVQDGTGVEASVAATGVQDGTGVEASVAATGAQEEIAAYRSMSPNAPSEHLAYVEAGSPQISMPGSSAPPSESIATYRDALDYLPSGSSTMPPPPARAPEVQYVESRACDALPSVPTAEIRDPAGWAYPWLATKATDTVAAAVSSSVTAAVASALSTIYGVHADAYTGQTRPVASTAAQLLPAAVAASERQTRGYSCAPMSEGGDAPAEPDDDQGMHSKQGSDEHATAMKRRSRQNLRAAAAAVVRARVVRLGRQTLRRMRSELMRRLLQANSVTYATSPSSASREVGGAIPAEHATDAVVAPSRTSESAVLKQGGPLSETPPRAMLGKRLPHRLHASPPKAAPLPRCKTAASTLHDVSSGGVSAKQAAMPATRLPVHPEPDEYLSPSVVEESCPTSIPQDDSASSTAEPYVSLPPGTGPSGVEGPAGESPVSRSAPAKYQSLDRMYLEKEASSGEGAGARTRIDLRLVRRAFKQPDRASNGMRLHAQSPSEKARARLAAHRVARQWDGSDHVRDAGDIQHSQSKSAVAQRAGGKAALSQPSADPEVAVLRSGESSAARLHRMRAEAALATALHRAMRQQLTASTAALLYESTARDQLEKKQRDLQSRSNALARHAAALQEQLEMARREAADATISAATGARSFSRSLGVARQATARAESERNRLQVSLERVLEAATEQRGRAAAQLDTMQRMAISAQQRVARAEHQMRRAAAAARAVIGRSDNQRLQAQAAAAACKRAYAVAVAAQRSAEARRAEAEEAMQSARMRYEAAEDALFEHRRLAALQRGTSRS